jgi:hypothetical protein
MVSASFVRGIYDECCVRTLYLFTKPSTGLTSNIDTADRPRRFILLLLLLLLLYIYTYPFSPLNDNFDCVNGVIICKCINWESRKERDHYKDLDIGGRIISE